MINDPNTTRFSRELEELKTAYLSALPAKVQRARKAWGEMIGLSWNEEHFKNVYRLFHNIAGGAGTYGLASISWQARVVLEEMKPSLNNGIPLKEETVIKINELVGLLDEKTKDAVKRIDQKTHYLRRPTTWNRPVQSQIGEIFLVEDDLPQSRYLSLMLGQAGHRVRVFNNLKDVRKALESSEPTAILMDMVFPEGALAGAEIIQSLQKNREMPIPIIFITTRTDIEARLSAVRAGAWHYFTKPIKVNSLVQLLNTYLNPDSKETKKILLIDDDPAISVFFASYLQKEENLEADILTEPERVLEVLDDIKPDLILMDYWMPECNGLELGAVIRQHEIYRDIPVIFLTEETNLETQLTALNIGSDDFLSKSMGPERLVLAVQSRLERIDRLKKAGNSQEWIIN